eukprot:m.256837 g.256837  ORF g.256837 m.256837 type:complete len:57 (-) comp34754_c0_seq1:175-345(-)
MSFATVHPHLLRHVTDPGIVRILGEVVAVDNIMRLQRVLLFIDAIDKAKCVCRVEN